MKSRLENGDILVELDEVLDEPMDLKKSLDKETIDVIATKSFHGLIYTQEEIKSDNSSKQKHTVYHSSEGQRFGITQHSIIKPLFPASQDLNMPATVVFRCKEKQIAENLNLAAKRWAALTRPVADPKNPNKFFEVPQTPFAQLRAEDNVTDEASRSFELYRAFRAHYRNHHSLPLSKNKGASCSNFIGYSLKVAIIDYLFPDGVPDAIQKKLADIEKIKDPKDAKKETAKVKKLADIHQQDSKIFAEFETLVVEEYNKKKATPTKEHNAKNESKSENENSDIFEFLFYPVKPNRIGDFCECAAKYPGLIEVGGYLFFKVGTLTADDHKKLSTLKPNKESPDGEEILTELKQISPGEFQLTDLELIQKLLHEDRLEKESIPILNEVLERLITPSMLDHASYFKLLEANELASYPYVVSAPDFDAHVKKAMEAKAESPRPSL